MKTFFISVSISLLMSSIGLSAFPVRAASFDSVRSLVSTGHLSAALAELESLHVKKMSAEQKVLWKFAKGVMYFENQKWAEAQKVLEDFVAKPSDLSAYAYYYLGMSLRNQNKLKEAEQVFYKTLKLKPPYLIKYQTRFALSEIQMSHNKWIAAFKNLYLLERKWRSTPRHPEVLWRLVNTDIKLNKRWRACRWARKIYSQYPSHALVYDWGIDLQNSTVEGSKIGCLASPRDQKTRIRRLQWAGESQRARKEIEELRSRTVPSTKYLVEIMFAEFLINEGFVDEALQTLLPLYEEREKDFDYLMLFAKAASRSGEFRAAVGAYHKAFDIKPNSASGRRALFQSAFLSYQFQDYDGAGRKFREFVQRYPRSGLSYDSKWHLAWIRYLRKDFEGAYLDLEHLNNLQRKSRRLRRKYPADRIRYWMAMSLFRMGDADQARAIFDELVNEEPLGYYALAARSRLLNLPKSNGPLRELAAQRVAAGTSDGAMPMSLAMNSKAVLPSMDQLGSAEEAETEESLSDEGAAESDGKEDEVEVAASEKEIEESEDPVTEFKSPKLQARFDRAKRLMDMGFYEWARWELFEIEKRTRNKTYLRMLMSAYEEIESYNRSSYISEIYFSSVRHKGGIDKEKDLWEKAYPRAFDTPVEYYADQFGLEEEFIWSIMRAESRYKADIASPVGAKGLLQLMPNTSRQVARMLGDSHFHTDTLVQPEVNIRLGSRYLHRLSKKFEGNMALVAAGYNAGPHRVESWLVSFGHLEMDEFIDHIPFLETRNYVKKVIRNYGIYKQLYSKESKPMAWLKDGVGVPIPAKAPTRENWETL